MVKEFEIGEELIIMNMMKKMTYILLRLIKVTAGIWFRIQA
jgi:hypothetical protein